DGMALNKYSSASTPPAEAPTPTMGNGLSIGSPSRDREETGLPAVGGARQAYAKALRIQRAFAGLAMRLDASVRDRSRCGRSTVVRADSISSRSCILSRRVVSINARVLVTRSRCSVSIELAREGSSGPVNYNGCMGILVPWSRQKPPLSPRPREGHPATLAWRGPRCRDPGPWPGFRFRGNERSFGVRISRTERDRPVERAHGLLSAAFSTVGGAPEQI